MDSAFLEDLIVAQLLKKFSFFYEPEDFLPYL
jgi:hypothetical protein